MRHSDPRLTTKTYTDAGQLPIGVAVRSLPVLKTFQKTDSQIDSQKLVADRLSQSTAVHPANTQKPDASLENKGESLGLAPLVLTSHTPDESASDRFKPCTAHHFSL